jgi:hypothetical protein
VAGARQPDAGGEVTVLFASAGPVGGHITITGTANPYDADLADAVKDTYDAWRDDPRYQRWMSDPAMQPALKPMSAGQ